MSLAQDGNVTVPVLSFAEPAGLVAGPIQSLQGCAGGSVSGGTDACLSLLCDNTALKAIIQSVALWTHAQRHQKEKLNATLWLSIGSLHAEKTLG